MVKVDASKRYLIRGLEAGEIPCRKVNRHRAEGGRAASVYPVGKPFN
jgi:hypothetical protein